jgi:hypothetical protein
VQIVDIVGGDRQVLTVVLAERAAPAPVPSSSLRPAAWITGASGVVAAAGGAVFFGLALDRVGAIRDECGPRATPPSCPGGSTDRANALSSAAEGYLGGAIGLFVVSGLALGTSVALFVADASAAQPDVTLALAPAGLVATWRVP